jgi:putative spermidine/putrescine transport system permease protein
MSFGNRFELLFPPSQFSLVLYRELFTGSDWLATISRSLRIALGTAVVSVLLGAPAAYGLVRGRFWLRPALLAVALAPLTIPTIVLALGLYFLFLPLGLAGSELSVLAAHVVIATPFVVVVCIATLQEVDECLEQAAAILGAGPAYVFRRVTLPMMMRGILVGAVFAFLTSFDEVVLSFFLNGTGAMTFPVKMFSSIQWEISPVLAAAASLMIAISIFTCLLYAAVQRRAH